MDPDKYIGRLLDNRYEILAAIGTGGMAVVYKARCHRLNRLVAIKILKDDLSQDEEFRRRFHAESQAVAMLSHPNIMSVYDVSTNDEADYIVMELIDGISLKQYMEKKGVLNWKETLHFSMQIAKALEHAHSRGIVHRDIKPHNIMVLKNGSVKVTDFGIARIMSKSNTLTKEALGSVHYISPEQAKGGRVDNRSDLYSLGVVMYEMMTGRAPYDGESPVSVAIQHINGGAAMPSTLNPNIPGGLEQIIMRLMAVEPSQRYATATNLLYDMEEFRKDPTVLFDFNHTPVEEVLKPQAPAVPPVEKALPRSTAERVAGARSPQTGAQRPRPQGGTAQRPQEQPGQRPQGGQRTQNGQRPQGSQQRPQNGQRPVQGQQTRQLTPEQIQRRAARQQEKREQEEKRTRMITMAVIGCSVVAVLAIIIFLWMLFNGGLFGPAVELLPVPNLVGLEYETLDREEYAQFTITLADYGYSDEYEAGLIMDQTPEAEDRVAEGTEIKVYVSQGPSEAEEIGTMEDLAGTTEDRAIQYLESLDGDLKFIPKTENSDTVEEGKVIRTVPAAGEPLHRGQTVTIIVSAGKEIVEEYVPVVEGKSYTEAVKALNAKGFMNILPEEQEESAKPVGEVIHQSVDPGTKTDVTTEITLTVSKGLKMPNLQGKTFEAAKKELEDLGFTQVSPNTVDSNEEKDTVLDQSVAVGSYCDATTKIILTVSNGIATKQVPNVLGKTAEEAKKALDDAGFKNVSTKEVDNTAPKGQVVDQSIKSGESVKVTDQIVLSVSKGPQNVTKKVTINLPADLTEPYVLTIMLADKEIYSGTIQPGTPSVTVEMTGRGVVQYEVFIDNLEYKTDKVDFNS